MGIVIHPFLFILCLVDILRTQYLKIVVQAIYDPRIELILSLLLFVILEYYFSIISYTILYD